MPAPTDSKTSAAQKPVTRQELYDLAWQEPMLRVAERFQVSSSYLARVFTELRVPRPAPGYWAQREFGKEPPIPSLPPARPGDLTEWSPGAFVGTTVRTVAKAIRVAAVHEAGAVDLQSKAAPGSPIKKRGDGNSGLVSKRHELLTGVKPFFLKTRKVENDILRPYKRLLVDILASEPKLDYALDTAQALFSALNRRGFHVGFTSVGEHGSRAQVELLEKPSSRGYHRAIWAPERPTVVHVDGVAIGLTLFEMTEEVEVVYVNGNYLQVRSLSEQQLRLYSGDRHWRSKQEHASGRFCLQAYCPYRLVKWSKRWPETKPGSFHSLIPSIVGEMETIAPELAKQLEEAKLRAEAEHRRWEEERRKWEAEAKRLLREKVNHESRAELIAAIAAWDEANRIRNYFASVEAEAAQLPDPDAARVRERLLLARELVGQLDPLALLKTWKAPDER